MAAREASDTEVASRIMEASFFMLSLHFLFVYRRLTQMVIGQTIAVPLLSLAGQYCCRHWRKPVSRRGAGGRATEWLQS